MPWAKVGPVARSCASFSCFGLQGVGFAEAIEEAPAFALLAAHGAAGHQEFAGAALADHARQQGTGAHVAAGQADPGEQEGGFRARGAQAQVGAQRQQGAGAGADAIDGGDDRLRAGAHGLDDVPGHAGEGE
jgi:hypothetical protein